MARKISIIIVLSIILCACTKETKEEVVERTPLMYIIQEFNEKFGLNYGIRDLISDGISDKNAQWIQFYDLDYPGFPTCFYYQHGLSISENLSNEELAQSIKRAKFEREASVALKEEMTSLFGQEIVVYAEALPYDQEFKDISSVYDINYFVIFIGTLFIEDIYHYRDIVKEIDKRINTEGKERLTTIKLLLFDDLVLPKYEINLCGLSADSLYYNEEVIEGKCGGGKWYVPKENIRYRTMVTN